MYFSDRERGARDRDQEEIGEKAWRGVIALVERKIDDGSLAFGFPDACVDTGQPFATDRRSFGHTLAAEIPDIDFPFNYGDIPDSLAILDLLEFTHRHVGRPHKGTHHSYFNHFHLTFDEAEGKSEFREDANRLLGRQGLIYELADDGLVRRIANSPAELALDRIQFATGDSTLDSLLSKAKRFYFSPNPDDSIQAVKELWDAWERLKTILDPSNKKQSISSLIAYAGTQSQFISTIETEAMTLTKIGNDFQIRHHEVGKTPLESPYQIRYFYQRLYTLIELLLPHLNNP